MQYTEKQQQAFTTRDRTLLVSAAAGSGKTAVLTKRIIDSLLDEKNPTDITRLLVVTFTKAAAADMKGKITRSLGDALKTHPGNRHLAKQLMLLGSASICTIDSFYSDLIHAHFEQAGISPTVRMVDEEELMANKREIMNHIVDEMYREETNFSTLADVFCDLRPETKLTDALLELYRDLTQYPEFLGILTRSADMMEEHRDDPENTLPGETFFARCREYLENGNRICAAFEERLAEEENEAQAQKLFGPTHVYLTERLATLESALESGKLAEVLAALAPSPAPRIPGGRRPPLSEEFKISQQAETLFRDSFGAFCNTFGVFSAEEVSRSAVRSAAILRMAERTLKRFHEEFTEWKNLREVCEFSDITHAVYRLLVKENGDPTPLARSISENYDAIYIDEYQDANAIQDATFRAISTPRNRFMVGDIKQSIYRFRGAQPAVFANYRKTFPEYVPGSDEECGTVMMSECFRCDKPIIDFTNTVFRFLFSHHAKRIGYTRADDLNFAKNTEGRCEKYTSPPCEVVCLCNELLSGAQQVENGEDPEIAWITAEILHLLGGETKADGTPIRPSDIAVLMRSGSLADPLAKVLAAANVPVNDTFRKNLFANPEVLCMYSLLATIDDPLRDVYLAATLRSPFFEFTLSDLVVLRSAAENQLSLYEALGKAANEGVAGHTELAVRCAQFLEKLSRWRDLAATLPVDKLLRQLYRETAVLSFAANGDENSGQTGRANLERLYQYARSFEANGFRGLYGFVRYVDDMMKNNAKIDAAETAGDAVTILTIHHSKGLEYPVCFVAGCGKYFNTKDLEPPLLHDEMLGSALLLPDAGPLSRSHTFWRNCIKEELSALSLEEEMRILYVALTRARERLYVTGKCRTKFATLEKEIALRAAPEAGMFATDVGSMLMWVLTALETGGCGDHTILRFPTGEELEAHCKQTPFLKTAAENSAAAEEELRNRFAFSYPFAHLSKLPAKLSVSKLSPGILDVFDTEDLPEDLNGPEVEKLLGSFDVPLLQSGQTPPPDAAKRGTATHEFLQFCDFENCEANGVQAELERLISKGFLAEEAREAVRLSELERFFTSALYGELKQAREIRRETRFNVFLPAKDFTADAEFAERLGDETLLVQGVIDLFFVNANGETVLCDYKTDRLTEAELKSPAAAANALFERHRRQLGYYKKALLGLTGQLPKYTYIYSLPAGRCYTDPQEENG